MARSYEKAPTRYYFPQKDFSSTNVVYVIRGPKGKAGQLYDIGVQGASVTFAGATTFPAMSVGTAASAALFGTITYGAVTAAIGGQSVRSLYDEANDNASFIAAIPLKNNPIPADTPVQVTLTAATGSGAAGTALPFIDIIWSD